MSEKTMQEAMADTATPRIPRDRYTLKIIEAEFTTSREKKTPYFNFKVELVGNSPIVIDGQEVDINGITGNKSVWLTEKTFSRKGGIGSLHKQLDLPLNITLNQVLAQPNTTMYVGGKFNAVCRTVDDPQKKDNGEPLLDSAGQQIVYSKFDVGDIV